MKKAALSKIENNQIWDVLGEQIICRLAAEKTNGRFTLVEETSPVGGMVPLHFHNETDEAVYVIEGRYEFTKGNETIIAGPGETLYIPRQTPHGFKNLGDAPGKLLAVISPSGFERFFAEINKLPKDELPDMNRIIELGRQNDLELVS